MGKYPFGGKLIYFKDLKVGAVERFQRYYKVDTNKAGSWNLRRDSSLNWKIKRDGFCCKFIWGREANTSLNKIKVLR